VHRPTTSNRSPPVRFVCRSMEVGIISKEWRFWLHPAAVTVNTSKSAIGWGVPSYCGSLTTSGSCHNVGTRRSGRSTDRAQEGNCRQLPVDRNVVNLNVVHNSIVTRGLAGCGEVCQLRTMPDLSCRFNDAGRPLSESLLASGVDLTPRPRAVFVSGEVSLAHRFNLCKFSSAMGAAI